MRRGASWRYIEEQLDLPALPIQFRDQFGLQGEVVGQEGEALAGLSRVIWPRE